MIESLLSMTGYGEATLIINEVEWRCVVQSVNSRYLDCRCRLPHNIQSLEPLIRGQVKKSIERGKVDIVFSYSSVEESVAVGQSPANIFNSSWVAGFCRAGEELLGSLEWPKTECMYSAVMQAAFARREAFDIPSENVVDISASIMNLLADSLDLHLESRSKEGHHLAVDFRHRLSLLSEKMADIEKLAVSMPQIFKERIELRLSLLLDDGPQKLDESRLCQEVAYLVDKADISEEIVRFRAHVAQFNDDLVSKSNNRKGKKLEFIVQEMLREINTVGSKANLLEITQNVIDIKNELEKIREQVQNVI
ncbi:MAG: YicC/YloC family endoribonuclease [Pseudomonadota bacterium]|nr:YicC/YloC family endoribonuclease [Pseudomonadota bacterium]